MLQKKEEKQFEQDIKDAVTEYSYNLDKENKDPRLLARSSMTGLLQPQRTKRLLAREQVS